MASRDLVLAELALLKGGAGSAWSSDGIARREREVMADLHVPLPRLAQLRFGEVQTQVVAAPSGFTLRLLLAPRRQGVLAAPARSGGGLLEDFEQLRRDIEAAGLRLLKGARQLEQRARQAVAEPIDPLAELLHRRACQQWRWHLDSGQLELDFPDAPRYLMDEAAYMVRGVVHVIRERQVTLRRVEVTTVDERRTTITLGKLPVVGTSEEASPPTWASGPLASLSCGQVVSLRATLRRSIIDGRLLGAVAQGDAAPW